MQVVRLLPAAALGLAVAAMWGTHGPARAQSHDGGDEGSPAGQLRADPNYESMTFHQNRADELDANPLFDGLPVTPPPGPVLRSIPNATTGLYLGIGAGDGLAQDVLPQASGSLDRSPSPRQLAAVPGRGAIDIGLAVRLEGPSYSVVAESGQSPDYRALVKLLGEDPARAAAELAKLVERMPENARLQQLLGAAYLEQGAYADAAEALRETLALGRDTPALRQGLGDALLGAGRPQAALEHMRHGPDTGRNRLGRAAVLIELDRPDEALPLLDEAARMEPSLAERAQAMKAGALKLAGREEDAERAIEQGRRRVAGTALEDTYDRIDAARPLRGPERRGYSVSFGAGYNDNVALARDGTGDGVFVGSARVWQRIAGDRSTGLTAEAAVETTQHAERGQFNEVFTDVGLRGYHMLAPDWRAAGGLSFDYGNIDGEHYVVSGKTEGELAWRQADWTESTLTYALAFRDFRFRSIAQEDRDGLLHRVTLAQDFEFRVAGRPARLGPYVSVALSDTDGASVENTAWSAGVNASYWPLPDVAIQAGGSYRHRDFAEPHIRSNFTTERSDDEFRAHAGVSYWLSDNVYLSFRYRRVDKDSNLPASFSYESNEYVLSIAVTGTSG